MLQAPQEAWNVVCESVCLHVHTSGLKMCILSLFPTLIDILSIHFEEWLLAQTNLGGLIIVAVLDSSYFLPACWQVWESPTEEEMLLCLIGACLYIFIFHTGYSTVVALLWKLVLWCTSSVRCSSSCNRWFGQQLMDNTCWTESEMYSNSSLMLRLHYRMRWCGTKQNKTIWG